MVAGRGSESSGATAPSATDHQEIEWQFDVDELEPVEAWLGQHSSGSGLVAAPESTVEISDTYYDAADRRLYRAGFALRVRETGGGVEATMKSLADAGDGLAGGGLRKRREISEPLEDDDPATLKGARGPVGERSRALLDGREMRPMFRVLTRRQRFALLLKDPTKEEVRIGEISLDSSEIPVGEEPERLRRVEVEAAAGETPDLLGFVDEMQFALELTPASTSKYEAGLHASGLAPTEVDPSMSAGEVAFAVLRGQFAEMRAHEPGTRLGEDPEELHDMRVPTRRMRAAIKVFEDALPERARRLGEELRWVARALGAVRDLDIQIERLRAWRAEADEETSGALDGILSLTRQRRAEAREEMLAVLDSERYGRLETAFAEMLRRAPAGEPITSAAPAILDRRYRRWRKAAERLDGASPPDAFHDVRKKGKRLRYTLEFVSNVYGEPVRRLVGLLKRLQDDLGAHQDAIVASEYLRELGTATGGPRIPRGTVFTMGVLSERCAREAAELRSRVPGSEPFRTLIEGERWRELDGVMKDAREAADVPDGSVR